MSRPEHLVSFNGAKGAGIYGIPSQSHKTPCPNSNNPYGHSPECECRRPSQSVPYEDGK